MSARDAESGSSGSPGSSGFAGSSARSLGTWGWAAVGSVVLHVGLVVAASLLPDGASGGAAVRDELFTPGAVIPIETVLPVAHAKVEPTPDPSLPSSTPDPETPATAPNEKPDSNDPSPSNGSEPPPDPTETETEPNQTPGLSLHGMRDDARASVTGRGSVKIDPALLHGSRSAYEDSVANPGVGGGAVQGPSPAPAGSRDYAFSNEKGKMVYRDPSGRFVAVLSPDGRVNFRNKGMKASWTNIGMAGPGDLLSAAAGDDPYARIKAKLLKATFEMRLGMAVSFQKRLLNKRLRRLEGELGKIWNDPRRSLPSRKKLLFERWDECDEPDAADDPAALPGFGVVDDTDIDAARLEAASSARKKILKFIREHAPKGSSEAFTADELAELNRRRASKQKFAPYE